jgi:hypothetical protein
MDKNKQILKHIFRLNSCCFFSFRAEKFQFIRDNATLVRPLFSSDLIKTGFRSRQGLLYHKQRTMSNIKYHIKSCICHYYSENLHGIHFYRQVTTKAIYLEEEQEAHK